MALIPFQGISFSNPHNLCYCNASVNGILASRTIFESIQPEHCACCDILNSKKTDFSIHQSSNLLKQIVASKHPEFDNSDQQDPYEFMSYIINECSVLSQLTQSEIISSYSCQNCFFSRDDSDSNERFKNIIHLNIIGQSITDIVSRAKTNIQNDWKRCLNCNEICNHVTKQNWLILPSVLIITLERFQYSQFAPVKPTINLNINEANYKLRAVISHHEYDTSKGHIVAHLFQGNGLWITCDDNSVSDPERKEPKDGYVFIYDKNEDFDSLGDSLSMFDSRSDQITSSKAEAFSQKKVEEKEKHFETSKNSKINSQKTKFNGNSEEHNAKSKKN